MKLFAKWFYNFDPVRWPALTFTKAGRTNLLRNSSPGDCIAFVGTKGPSTKKEKQEKILGIAMFGREEVDTLELVPKENLEPRHYKEGELRWPAAIPILKAWEIIDPPFIKEFLGHQLPQQARTYAVELSDEDKKMILSLPMREIEIPKTKVVKLQLENVERVIGKISKGPPPSSWSGQVNRNANVESFTYAIQFGKRDIWKIGYSRNIDKRLRAINSHIPTEVTKEKWHLIHTQKWGNADDAYGMEQGVLSILKKKRTQGERLICSAKELLSGWKRAVSRK